MKNQVKRILITVITTCVVLACTETTSLQISDESYSVEEMIQPYFQNYDEKDD